MPLIDMPRRFHDPEHAESFRAYRNYFEDLAETIDGLYGSSGSLTAGAHDGVENHLRFKHVQRRVPDCPSSVTIKKSFQRSWATLRCLDFVVEDSEIFYEDANAWIPMQVYYAVYHAMQGFAISSGQSAPKDHAGTLKLIGKEVVRGILPTPWDVWCKGYPHIGELEFGGLVPSEYPVHVLSPPDPLISDDRLAMLLRTTRQKELDRRFAQERKRNVKPGRTRRNLTDTDKRNLAKSMAPTTLFDVLWRIRKKANYEDADAFVLGANDKTDAWQLAKAFAIVTDGTVAVFEALAAAYVGPRLLADISQAYADRTRSDPVSAIGRRAASWQDRTK